MNYKTKDIIVFSSFITLFSIISINTAITIALINGIMIGIGCGIGILLCVGLRHFIDNFPEDGQQKKRINN